MVKIGLKALCRYMTTASASQRKKILRDYKYPDPEGMAQAMYYREARDLITTFHRLKHHPEWLQIRADELKALSTNASGTTKVRYQNNSRALTEYSSKFGMREFDVLEELRWQLHLRGVTVTVVPDLHVLEKGHERIIKLEFSKEQFDSALPRYMCQIMYEAACTYRPQIQSSGVLLLDVHKGKVHKGARANARARGILEDTCVEIAERWESI